uniref:calcium uniporter n=1 Tax=Metarhizium acridum (strain CQMa 102) TaxID=655827 RepID=UPI000DCF63F8|nr:Chain A, calcium uniporter [Metarhizium acridum CQMa 102]6C5R_B Chain B, calcium uniporter [Metarhizium acridum CQMa 102]6C5R_C Chain C, calcium uniporter [Metarhizium acridum CQMa 102]6C5R_D Chain D, calcium uniporter [Metarhizium acridum CQMa 102]6C5R_E Chain E, calcium uniporter [Metarhizium acridum CQMa 102]6C5R_F Chain F, calcium uniporter [Metarhizium acridum CQMa 102]6C5R_G Chain G, calcium uniporter [Metarhizium acridum CQMa 102]6C5R_H Chain H, calcium uniporter [Metarhizium acrid
GPMMATKGRLLTTPTRLLKLILPIPFHPEQEYINSDETKTNKPKEDAVEPLALLVHPQQPLSYLERLIQAEIPPLLVKDREKLPEIIFRAEADYTGGNGDTHWVRWSGSTEIGDFIRDAARGREFSVTIEGHAEELRVAVPSFKDRTYYMRMRLRRMSQEIDQMATVKREAKWDQLVHDANGLRREIKFAATEYGVEWDEMKDLGGEEVK